MIKYKVDITKIKKLIEDENTDLRVIGRELNNDPIYTAINTKNFEVMKIIFDTNGDLINMKSPGGLKPVHWAVVHGVKCLETLIPYGVDFESKTYPIGYTPLAMACMVSNFEVIEYLVETVGVEIDSKSRRIIEEEIDLIEFKNRVLELFRRNTY